jgi:hypothetical protein
VTDPISYVMWCRESREGLGEQRITFRLLVITTSTFLTMAYNSEGYIDQSEASETTTTRRQTILWYKKGGDRRRHPRQSDDSTHAYMALPPLLGGLRFFFSFGGAVAVLRLDFDFVLDAVGGGSSWSLGVGRVMVTLGAELAAPRCL